MLRPSRGNVKLLLGLSVILNVVVLVALFVPSKQAHELLGEETWAKITQLGNHIEEHRHTLVPEKSCSMCAVDPRLCNELGEENLKRSLGYVGTNLRLRRTLSKLKRGGRLTAGVVGGSVSKGFGIDKDPAYYPDTPTNLNRIVFDRLNTLFPAPNGVKVGDSGRSEDMNSFINGAQGGVGTDYFSLCYGEHLPEDMDLVFIELAINDEVLLRNINSYELLVRSLLDLPRHPAIMNLQVFALEFNTVTNGAEMHTGVAQSYDLPVLSLRNALYHEVLKNASLVNELFWVSPQGKTDLRHIGEKGHNLMGRIGAAYVDSQLCEMEKYEASIPGAKDMSLDQLYPLEPLPRMQVNMKYNADLTLPPIKPQCFSANGHKNPLVPLTNQNWRKWNWKEKNYLVADQPGARVSFKLHTTVGNIEVHYLRSWQYKLGSAKCWVDGDENKAKRLEGYWDQKYNIGRAATIRDDLAPGEHTLTCELLKETADPEGGLEFRLISVMRSVSSAGICEVW
ncbi:hypothetical protein L198_03195 [Cryptococcus wingfieldii CBS 7118]|uniref:CAP64 gene product-related n=1 Tax=Cryptococcus wingfieldii CBS 7118 TaxID=1295528 RepID=A0A1E3JEP7_9TREE|nr:hypothetical protein L198_03195 [Cryptococcus wingfieldii CBS 7118]ODN99353.1 hypothetical protein L198_03195 [Cryptococcus wingfieldii CBS 7118]